jgi:hypothetical protein
MDHSVECQSQPSDAYCICPGDDWELTDSKPAAQSVTDRILIPLGIPERDRSLVALHANRNHNMTGARYSDALRAEAAGYLEHGRAAYLRLTLEANHALGKHATADADCYGCRMTQSVL